MEIYILDALLRRTEVIDKFISLIWTDRFQDLGDFELVVSSTSENRSWLTTDTLLAINTSYRVMVIDKTNDTVDDDDIATLTITGHSIETVLNDRVVKNTYTDLTTEPTWDFSDTPGNICRTMFDHICRDGILFASDIIPFLVPGSIYSTGTIPEYDTEILWSQAPDQLFTPIQQLCQLYDLGFRLVRNQDSSQLYFDIYSGNDRTTQQTDFPPVIFSPSLDDLQNTTKVAITEGSKNVAYVFSTAGTKTVYDDNVDPTVTGFVKRVLVVNADIADGDPDPDTTMQQAGAQALIAARATEMFDGELNQYGSFTYEVDYTVGDLVEMRDQDGNISYKRVTEQIFSSDANGDTSYPTLAADLFAGIDDWISWNASDKAWADFTDEFWAQM